MKQELLRLSADQFVALILDNEVTVGDFVKTPPLSWTRLVQRNGIFQVAEGYPTNLTAAQAKFEMRNWDEVSLPAIVRGLEELNDCVDYVLFGNNAAIIYANSLPEKSAYERLGYRTFFRRSEAVSRLVELAKKTSRPLALCFINTIQHNELNYHDP